MGTYRITFALLNSKGSCFDSVFETTDEALVRIIKHNLDGCELPCDLYWIFSDYEFEMINNLTMNILEGTDEITSAKIELIEKIKVDEEKKEEVKQK